MTLVFEKTLVRASETRSFQIHRARSDGWESCETTNEQVALRQHHSDWHQVERAVARFWSEIAALRGSGWREPSELRIQN